MKPLIPLIALIPIIALTACHGITPNPSPAAPTPVTLTAQNIVVTPMPAELPIGGGGATIRLEVRTLDGRAVPGVPVALGVDGGALADTALVTDATGHALTTWTGTASATISATSETARGAGAILVHVPIVYPPVPPPTLPPPVPPLPPQPPTPPQPAALVVTLTASPAQVAESAPTTLTAAVAQLQAGESIIAYQWDFDGNGLTDETTVSPTRTRSYATSGLVSPRVVAVSSSGRTAAASLSLVVFKP